MDQYAGLRAEGRQWTEIAALSLFLRAARVVDDRVVDVPERARRKIVAKLEKSGVAASKLRALVDYQPLSKADQASLYGEALPVGLVFG